MRRLNAKHLLAASAAVFSLSAFAAVDPDLAAAAKELGERAAKVCDPAFEGDKKKGELTIADIEPMILKSAEIPASFTNSDAETISAVWQVAVTKGIVICPDSRVSALPADSITGGRVPTAAAYITKNVMSLSPKPSDPKRPLLSFSVAAAEATGNMLEKILQLPRIVETAQALKTTASYMESALKPEAAAAIYEELSEIAGIFQMMTSGPMIVSSTLGTERIRSAGGFSLAAAPQMMGLPIKATP